MAVASVKEQIVREARDQFLARGFSKVTMDEIALALHISKRTMYENFRSKDELLDAVIEWQFVYVTGTLKGIIDSPADYLEKFQTLWTTMGDILSRVSRQMQDDLRRLRPDLWKRMEAMRREHIFTLFGRFIDDGVRYGFIRADVNKEILLLIYVHAVQGIVNPETLSRHSFSAAEAFQEIIRSLFDGILTDSARAHFHVKAPLPS